MHDITIVLDVFILYHADSSIVYAFVLEYAIIASEIGTFVTIVHVITSITP